MGERDERSVLVKGLCAFLEDPSLGGGYRTSQCLPDRVLYRVGEYNLEITFGDRGNNARVRVNDLPKRGELVSVPFDNGQPNWMEFTKYIYKEIIKN